MKKPHILSKIRIGREQICCLTAALALTGLSLVVPRHSTITDGYTILRTDPGGASTEYELKLGGISDKDETISVTVSSRQYTEEEANSLFDALMEELAVHIVGDNENLDRIDTDLSFPKSIPDYPGIKITIYPADTDLIKLDGTVNNADITDELETYLRVTLKTGNYERKFVIPVTVIPRTYLSGEEIKAMLLNYIEDADEEQIEDEALTLPQSFEGLSLSYSEKKDHLSLEILLGGIFATVLVGLRPRQEQKKQEKARENELLEDYSEIISRLIVYMGAGLSVRNAWLKTADDYRQELMRQETGHRAAYDEMLVTAGELRKGEPESRALGDFARRCGQKCYMRLVSILEQNMKNGDQRSLAALDLEMQEALEQRRNIARKRGEEAGTKLIVPLMISLLTVLIITAAPAFMSFT